MDSTHSTRNIIIFAAVVGILDWYHPAIPRGAKLDKFGIFFVSVCIGGATSEVENLLNLVIFSRFREPNW